MRGAVVGAGVMGQHHLRVLGALYEQGVTVTTIVEPDPSRREAAVDGLRSARGYESLGDALASEQLDFVCVATPTEHLPAAATQAVEAGLHVLVEKPMAPDLHRARELLALSEQHGSVFTVGLVERCNPAVRSLRDKLAEGRAGQIMQLHARRLSPFPNRRAQPGVALDLATHDIDVMRYITDAEVERVYAETASLGGDGEQADGEDLVCSTLRFDNGVTGLLETNWISPAKVRQLSVTCERGMFVVDYLSQDLTFYEHPTKATVWEPLRGLRGGGEGDMIRYALERWEPLRVQWEAFFGAVRGGAPVTASAADGCAVVAIAEAIRASGADSSVIEFDHARAQAGLA
jgi:predicted dehydrogenase